MTPAPLIAIIQHQDECPPALLADWLTDAGAELRIVRPDLGAELPAVGAIDGLIVLGGVMGATDDAVAPWLPAVRALIAQAADAGLPTLGVCLGHQLAATALGGRVARNPNGKQRGLTPIGFTADADGDPLVGALPRGVRGVHSNNDVAVALPEHATVLARASGGEVQAARLGASVWGVQWHPEVDEDVFATWCAIEPPASETDAQRMIAEVAAAHDELADAWRPLAARFVALCAMRARRPESGERNPARPRTQPRPG